MNFDLGAIKYNISDKDGIYYSTKIKDLICIPYFDTEAGSNPREFQGLTIINIAILKSVLEDPKRFWTKHLGISITIKGGVNKSDENILKYNDACITNGLQTLSIFRVLIMIKIYQEYKNRNEVHKRIPDKTVDKFRESIRKKLDSQAEFFLSCITIKQINSMLNWFDVNERYLALFNQFNIEDLLDIKIKFSAVILDEIISIEEEEDFDTIPRWGNDIANANNDTQNVKIDDKFGTKFKTWFEDGIMQNVDKINIEYRKCSNSREKSPSKHILEILRAIIPTTLLIDCKKDEDVKYNIACTISKYANNRTPVYNIFEKFINISNKNKDNIQFLHCIEIMKNLMPHIIRLMLIFDEKVNLYYRNLTFEDVLISTNEQSENLKTRLGMKITENNKEELDKVVRKQLRFSPSNIFPIFIFATRKTIIINEKLEVEYNIDSETIGEMIDKIYKTVLRERITRQYGSTSDLFRDARIYTESYDAYNMWTQKKFQIDYIEPYRINLNEN